MSRKVEDMRAILADQKKRGGRLEPQAFFIFLQGPKPRWKIRVPSGRETVYRIHKDLAEALIGEEWTPIAYVSRNRRNAFETGRHRYQSELFVRLIQALSRGLESWPDGTVLLHTGRCSICGRLLTNPRSVDRGIGPICWSKLQPTL